MPVHPLPAPPPDRSSEQREVDARHAGGAAGAVLDRLDSLDRLDLVYERYSLWGRAAMPWARSAGRPGVLEVNAPLPDEQARHRVLHDRAAADDAARDAIGAASVVIAVSAPVAAWASAIAGSDEAAGSKVHVVANGVDVERFRPADRRPVAGPTCTIGFVGTLKAWHGIDTLASAFTLLAAADPCYRLLIVGDGPERAALAAKIAADGLTGRVELVGAVDPACRSIAAAAHRHRRRPVPGLGWVLLAAQALRVPGGWAPRRRQQRRSGRRGARRRAHRAAVPPGGSGGAGGGHLGAARRPGAGRFPRASWTGHGRAAPHVALGRRQGPRSCSSQRTPGRHMTQPDDIRAAAPGLARTLRRFRPHIRRQRRIIAGGSVALIAEVLLRLLEPWPLKLIIDTVAQPVGVEPTTVPENPQLLLLIAALGVVALTALRALASYVSTVAFALAGNRILTDVRAELYAHLQRLSLAFHTASRSGDLVNRITGDIGRLQEITVTAALPLIGNIVTFVGMFAVMAWLDWQLALLALVALPLFVLTSIRLTKRITTVSRTQRAREGELASAAAESLGAIRVVQAYSLEPTLQRAFASTNDRTLRDGVKAKRLSAGLERKTDVLIAVATGLVLYIGARSVLAGRITPGELVVFVSYLKSAFKPMRDLAKYTGRLAKAAASGERIVDLLETAPDVQDAPGARPAGQFHGEVRFEDVTVEYSTGRPALDRIDFTVRPGQRVGVLGPSGAGKSTLVSLLLRLRDPTSGRVLIDGHDLRDLTMASVRGQIAIVLQESVLFVATVRENIAYGAPDIDRVTDAEIEAAARSANAHDFIGRLPDGYDTVLGERGASLSGGERQRIAIARAAVRQATIIVLDEATTGLDGDNEQEVTDALRRLTRGRTTFVISHDPHAVADADVVLRIEAGQLTAFGSPGDVLKDSSEASTEAVLDAAREEVAARAERS